MKRKHVLCSSCDIVCQLDAEVQEGRVTVRAADPRPLHADICMKGVHSPSGFRDQERVLFPMRRRGERGSNQWERVTWDSAMDDIATRLEDIVRRHGPEAFAVSTSQWNTSTDNGAARRFMNLLGSPNWVSGVAFCAGNTAAINRMVYGWFPFPDIENSNCIVLFGHNPKKHSWTPIYNLIRRAQKRGAKLIVLDPRRSENAELADLWLPLRAGTDTAMCMGWLKVIIDEHLYDSEFVAKWTVGFEEFRARVDEFPLERVAEITGVSAQLIATAARMYASSTPGVIPWTPITDQQRNSTSAIRLQCILRALTGNLDVPGGEMFIPFHPDIISETELELHGHLSQAQKDKQLGAQTHPAFTYRGTGALREPTLRVWGTEYANIISGSYMANPSALFRAMADEDPYPVKAFFVLANNSLLSYANMQLVYRAMMNQELIVAHEHRMTPTAQLADYVLPGDSWAERPSINDYYGWGGSIVRTSMQLLSPPGECRGAYDFWHDLAHRTGLGEHFPWKDQTEILDYRVARFGMKYEEFAQKHRVHVAPWEFRKYETTGFATPSGKVELKSAVLGDLGFDPLPYFRPDPVPKAEFNLRLITGIREDAFFQTGHRHIPALRARAPEPNMFINPADAAARDLNTGDWVVVTTAHGQCQLRTLVRDDMPVGLIRVPHGWWKPEMAQGRECLSGAWLHADAQLCGDEEDDLDLEQGIPHFKGIPCSVSLVPPADILTQRG